jgi:DNA-binding NtrC family response regulator
MTRAAAHLGITRRTLGYRIKKYGLEDVIAERAPRAGRRLDKA